MTHSATYGEDCERRFGVAADALGFDYPCVRREDFVAFLSEEGDPPGIPDSFREQGRFCHEECMGQCLVKQEVEVS